MPESPLVQLTHPNQQFVQRANYLADVHQPIFGSLTGRYLTLLFAIISFLQLYILTQPNCVLLLPVFDVSLFLTDNGLNRQLNQSQTVSQ